MLKVFPGTCKFPKEVRTFLKQGPGKILLVNPPFYRLYKDTYSNDRYPLSLGYLSGTIKKETDWNVMVYDADHVLGFEKISISYLAGLGFKNYLRNLRDLSNPIWETVRSVIVEYAPRVVGIYCTTQNSVSASRVAKLAKEICPETIVVVGGPHPTMIRGDMLVDQNIDVVVKGEGERTVVDLLDAIDNSRSLSEVKGIVYRTCGRIAETADREFIEDLNSLCYPHEHAHDVLKHYKRYPPDYFRHIFATRGCPYNCFFCGSRYLWGRRVRFRSVPNVINEIKSLRKMTIRRVVFDDDTFGVNKEYIRDLCNSLIDNRIGIEWECETHVNLIDEDIVALMKKAGCQSIALGIESGNNEMLRKISKGFTVEKAMYAADTIVKNGLMLWSCFIIGFPDETEDTLNDTFAMMKRIKGGLVYSIFTPYPGTEAFEFCKNAGLIGDSYDVALYNHQSPENCFCRNIEKQRFRVLASEIEKYVDRRNASLILSLNALKRCVIGPRSSFF